MKRGFARGIVGSWFALAFGLSAAGCSGGGSGGAKLEMSAVVPANGATGVSAVVDELTVTFDAPLDGATVDETTFVVEWGTESIPGELVVSGPQITFRPLQALPYGQEVRVTAGSDIESVEGDSLDPFPWTFTVEADTYKQIFVTSETGDGDLGSWASAGGETGLAAADAICMAAAARGNLIGTFRAVISDGTTDAWCHLHGLTGKLAGNCGLASLPADAGPWVRTGDHFPFSGDVAELFAAPYAPIVPVGFDELGRNTFFSYWTNTDSLGRNAFEWSPSYSSQPCMNWAAAVSTTSVGLGSASATSMTWTQGSLSSCSYDWSLLCLETGAGPALTLPASPQGAKIVFVTDTGGTGNLASWSQSGGLAGLAGGDAICVAQATDANLPNAASFKAWLSTTAVDAADRITSDGPWMRRDGVLIAQSKADLLDGTIFTSINRTATDQPYGPAYVWTGTADDGTKAANTCSDWTNGTSGANGAYGDNSSTTQPREWSGDAASFNYCDRGDRLYCFED